ncbi:MAG TPA: hypothetical protein VHV10_21285, partial [Ktedonobacteraceae bacterium]|nr:hypothetical protein [Ktedonobacteraceae bacterium]
GASAYQPTEGRTRTHHQETIYRSGVTVPSLRNFMYYYLQHHRHSVCHHIPYAFITKAHSLYCYSGTNPPTYILA